MRRRQVFWVTFAKIEFMYLIQKSFTVVFISTCPKDYRMIL